MKVLEVVMDNRIGGVQKRVLDVTPFLIQFGTDCTVLTPSRHGGLYDELVRRHIPVEVCRYSYPRRLKSSLGRFIILNLYWISSFPLGVLCIYRKILKNRIDIVQINGLFGFQAALAALLSRKTIVWVLIGSAYPHWMVRLLIHFVILSANRVVLIAKSMATYYRLPVESSENDFASKYTVIYECVNTDYYQPLDALKRQELRSQLSWNKDDIILTFVGNLTPRKGVLDLMEAFLLAKSKVSNLSLVIVGPTVAGHEEYFERIKQKAEESGLSESIRFLGARNDIRGLLQASDLFCMASYQEGTPIAILEAMACGLPVIATSVGGIPEQVQTDMSGVLVSPGNIDMFASSIEFLAKDELLRRDMGHQGRLRVCQLFSVQACAEKYNNVFSELCDRQASINKAIS